MFYANLPQSDDCSRFNNEPVSFSIIILITGDLY